MFPFATQCEARDFQSKQLTNFLRLGSGLTLQTILTIISISFILMICVHLRPKKEFQLNTILAKVTTELPLGSTDCW
jgi:hypothetical protein